MHSIITALWLFLSLFGEAYTASANNAEKAVNDGVTIGTSVGLGGFAIIVIIIVLYFYYQKQEEANSVPAAQA